jgi:hypothetical protein
MGGFLVRYLEPAAVGCKPRFGYDWRGLRTWADSGRRTNPMTKSIGCAVLALMLLGAPTLAFADASCATQATDKKLAGAAKTSFLKKCDADATVSCDKQAADKKLAGAAKTSFTKKCVKDATGE